MATLPSGLQTAQGDLAITLVHIDADTIEGQYEDGGTQVAFTIEIGGEGKLTYTQEVPLEQRTTVGCDGANDTNSPIDFGGPIGDHHCHRHRRGQRVGFATSAMPSPSLMTDLLPPLTQTPSPKATR